MDEYFKALYPETKRALDSLLSEFGATLPVDFSLRILRISSLYMDFYRAVSKSTYVTYESSPYIVKLFDTIISQVHQGRSINDIRESLAWLTNRLEALSTQPPNLKVKEAPIITRVRVVESKDGRDGGENDVMAVFPRNEGSGITLERDCRVDVEIEGVWHKIWELRISSRFVPTDLTGHRLRGGD